MYSNTQRSRRIGILGGTFNPAHIGHIEIAEYARSNFNLDEVLLIVAKDPPHKQVTVSAQQRLTMAILASKELSFLRASGLELAREGKSYTFDTVAGLNFVMPGAEFFLILGDDMLKELHTWYRADELLRITEVIAIPRGMDIDTARETARKLNSAFGARVHVLDVPVSPISSTLVRERVYNARPIRGLVPPDVERYIYETGLYQPEDVRSIIEKCANGLNEKRFAHTVGVLSTAIELAHIHNIDPNKARIAALLHDYGRRDEKGALEHADVSARLTETEFNINDAEIVSAIRRHTTLGANASQLDKLIYVADMIEPSREFEGLEPIRKMASHNIDEAVIMGLRGTVSYLNDKGLPIAAPTLEAIDDLTGTRRQTE